MSNSTGSRLRAAVVEGPSSLGARSRRRRWDMVRECFPDLSELSVLDVGGTIETWERAPVRPASVHLVNLGPAPADLPDWASAESGDACAPSPTLRDRRFDLVFSNSVLEHVGGHERRQRFADLVHDMAPRHWVQTPYRYFPVEPHFLFPGFQFLPAPARATVAQKWPLLHSPSADRGTALDAVLEVELIGRTELSYYFPASRILFERIAGLPKSLVAVRHP